MIDLDKALRLLTVLEKCAQQPLYAKFAAEAHRQLAEMCEEPKPVTSTTAPIYPKDAPQAKPTNLWDERKDPITPKTESYERKV